VNQITCPFGGCIYRWCRLCGQGVIYGRIHTCDGAAELAQTMEENRWKACPDCGTRIEKSAGCYHMTCPSPGCYTHVCYRDGQFIIRSQDWNAIREAVHRHYENCQQFDPPPARPGNLRNTFAILVTLALCAVVIFFALYAHQPGAFDGARLAFPEHLIWKKTAEKTMS